MKFQSLLLILSLLFTRRNLPQIQHGNTWEGEIDGVKSWVTLVAGDRRLITEQLNSQDWNDWGNTDTDTYLFAFEDPENVRLILSFVKMESSDFPCAKIYLNDHGKQNIQFEVIDGELKVLSNKGYPNYIIYPQNGSWLINGQPNYNLEIHVDGVDSGHILEDELITDGVIDKIIKVGSSNGQFAEWQTSLLINDPHPSWGYPRFEVRKRFQPKISVSSQRREIIEGFPYFAISKQSQNYFTDDIYPLFYDLQNHEFRLGYFPGFQDGGIWSINSVSLPPKVSFETPFVFYNFDEDDRYAELVIRSEYVPRLSELAFFKEYRLPTNNIRYSWKTVDNALWQYGLQIQGSKELDDVISVGEFELMSVSPENFPGWVIDSEWPTISFVEAVDGYSGSEGIYYYGGINSEIWPWLLGEEVESPSYFLYPNLPLTSELTDYSGASIPLGFRAEYTWGLNQKPELYFSEIDKKIHLINAKGGTWNLSENMILRYENKDEDAYIDYWVLEEVNNWEVEENFRFPITKTEKEALYNFYNYLVFSSRNTIIIIHKNIPDEFVRFSPPTSKITWEDFLSNIEPLTESAEDPQNLKSWLDEFTLGRTEMQGVQASDFQILPEGFSFILKVFSGFSINSSGENPFTQLEAGDYFIKYIDGEWTIREFVPSKILFGNNILFIDRISKRANQLVRVSATIENTGDGKSSPVSAELWVSQAGQPPIKVNEQTLTLGGNQAERITLDWLPAAPGTYSLEMRLNGKDVQGVSKLVEEITILPSGDAQFVRAVRLSQPSSEILLFILLSGISLSAILLMVFVHKNYIEK